MGEEKGKVNCASLQKKGELSEGGFYVIFMDIRQYHHIKSMNPTNALRTAWRKKFGFPDIGEFVIQIILETSNLRLWKPEKKGTTSILHFTDKDVKSKKQVYASTQT